jgi:hypothetical protein
MHGEVPPAVLTHYCQRRAFIDFLEAWAMIATLLTLQCLPTQQPTNTPGNNSHRTPTRPSCYIDNEAARHALLKGYGKDDHINGMTGMFWALMTEHNTDPWFQRVSTHSNPADAISREDFAYAQAKGWTRLHPQWQEIYEILIRCSTDILFAHRRAPTLAVESLKQQLQISVPLHSHTPAADGKHNRKLRQWARAPPRDVMT